MFKRHRPFSILVMDNSFSEKYFVTVLRYLLERGTVKKYDLKAVMKSSNSIDKLVPKLEKDALIIIKEEMLGRKTYLISLTPKGRIIAENLAHLEENRITISEGLVSEIEKIIKRDKSHSSVEECVNEATSKAIEKWKMDHAGGVK